MSDNISASPEFRLQVLALLLFSDWLLRYGPIIKPEHFPSDDEQSIVEWVNAYFMEYHSVPSDADLAHGLNDNLLLEDVYNVSDADLFYASTVAIEFAQVQSVKLGVLSVVDQIQTGDLSGIRDTMADALRIGQDAMAMGWDLVDDRDEWLHEELRGRRFPTGYVTLDKALGGGIIAGEYGLVMAPPGGGKTTMLINIGFALAGLLGRANVLHLTAEMSAQKVLKRYAVRVSGMPLLRDEQGDADRFLQRFISRAKQNLRAHLHVAYLDDKTLDGIRRIIDGLHWQGFATDALIVDYADLMHAPTRRNERRFELADIARGLRDMGNEYGIPVWSATQAGRQAIYKPVVTMFDIAEAIEKAAVADVILGICRTREEEELGTGRIYAAKMRDAAANFVVHVRIDFSKQIIVQRDT